MMTCIWMCVAAMAGPGDKALDLHAPFVLVSQKKSTALDDDLRAAAEAGYRVTAVTQTGDGRTNLLMEKQSGAKYAYQMLRSPDLSRLKTRIEEAGREGYRLVPGSMMVRGKMMSDGVFMLLMERAPDAEPHDYRVLISEWNSSLRSVLDKLADEGFHTVGLHTGKDDLQLILMEKTAK